MNMRQLVRLSGALTYLAIPAGAAGQVGGGVEFFGALDNSFPLTRTIGGLSLSLGTPYIGIRGSGGLGISTVAGQATAPPAGSTDLIWATDADLILGPVNAGLGQGFMPYTFAGVGIMSSAEPVTFTDAIRTWSYGGGLQLGLGRLVSVNGEVRARRLAAAAAPADSQLVKGLEYRVGIGLHFGGPRQREYDYSVARRSDPSPPRASRAPRAPRPSGGSRTTWPVINSSAAGAARRVVPSAERYLGVPYRYGGSTPRGFDCSGFVQYVYGEQGVSLPRTSRQQAGAGMAISPSTRNLVVGDLMLFAQGGKINHVAIYAGNGRFIHSSSSGNGVRYDNFGTRRGRWFTDHMVAVRRVSGDSRVLANALTAAANIAFDHFDPPDQAPPPTR